MMRSIEFNKTGHDARIDYVKGLCIIFVILTHCMDRPESRSILFPYWGDAAVPIFLIIQVFHYYKKGFELRLPSLRKLCRRILVPFAVMTALMFAALYARYYADTDGHFLPQLYWSRRGPGSYYIFVYLEFAILIPLLAPLMRRLSARWLLVVFIALSQFIEVAASLTHCPDSIYRVLFLRYTFLIYIGYLLATRGLQLNALTIGAGIVSMGFVYVFHYTDIDLEPLFYTNLGFWQLCHWVCYFYVAYFLLGFLVGTYGWLQRRGSRLPALLEAIGQYSYEVYLFQIFYYATVSIYVGKALTLIGYEPVQHVLYMVLCVVICVAPALLKKHKMVWPIQK